MHAHDQAAALSRLLRFLAVEGVTGQEKAIGEAVARALVEAGVPSEAITFDDAHTRIPLPTETGNLIVKLPGTGRLSNAEAFLFMTHLDTVPLCAGAKPRLAGDRIVNDAPTALGGDNRTGCAVLVTLAAELIKSRVDHPPLVLVFCVREESGLWGARHIDLSALGPVTMGFNWDGHAPVDAVNGAVGGIKWVAEIRGRASHAGVAPERGISATMILALALAEARTQGWFGKVVKGDKTGTSNVGPVSGAGGGQAGDATNVVTDYIRVEGESRSQDEAFMHEITTGFETAFMNAAAALTNSDGKAGSVTFTPTVQYYPFAIDPGHAAVTRATAAIAAAGLEPSVRLARGGLDANWLVRHGVSTVTLGAGQNEVHTVDEWIDVPAFQKACEVAIRIATAG